jgi:hypothetical protein
VLFMGVGDWHLTIDFFLHAYPFFSQLNQCRGLIAIFRLFLLLLFCKMYC